MFKLTIAEAENIVYEGDVEILNVVTKNDGQVGILTNHVSCVDIVKASEMSFVDAKGVRHTLAVSGGWLFVWPKNVTVLVNSSEFASEIDIEKAKKQKDDAMAELSRADLDTIQRVHAQARLEKALNRLKISSKNQK